MSRWFRRGGAPFLAGRVDVAQARQLADAERALGAGPPGCMWLDERTVDDLELPLVFDAIDRTTTVVGAQALWRWLAAPACSRALIEERAARIDRFADHDARDRLRAVVGAMPMSGADQVARLLWSEQVPSVPAWRLVLQLGALVVCGVLAWWWPPLAVGCLVVVLANILLDDWANLRVAQHARGLAMLGTLLDTAAELADEQALARRLGAGRRELAAGVAREIATDLAAVAGLRRRIAWLSIRDPFGLLDMIRAALLGRLLVLAACLGWLDREGPRLRRIVLWLGELDAACSVAALRAERPDAHVPELVTGEPRIVARGLVHPAIDRAIGNDVELARGGLLVTGSNMSGKSTFLRTVAVNAICAQAIATTFGTWNATLLRVHSVMKIADDTARGRSTYAVEVAAVRELVANVTSSDGELGALFVLDEPFRGTNPVMRVPIVVAVVEYLGARDLALVATHDLEVAAQLGEPFARGYFGEQDHVLRPGIAASQNALAMLVDARYPAAILAEVQRRTVAGS